MDRFDRINNIREQQPIPGGEMPSSQDKTAKARSYAPFPKIVAIILIAALILTVIYALIHPIDKINLKFFLFDNCTVQVVITSFGEYKTKDVHIDVNSSTGLRCQVSSSILTYVYILSPSIS